MVSALSGNSPRFAGVCLYIGPSMLDGAPIMLIANRIVQKSTNEKTGALVQTFIIRADMKPNDAIKSGDDASICGDCPHRGTACYVNVSQSVTSVYAAFTRKRYAMPGLDYDPAIIPDLFAGRKVRLGTYGDPCAVPFQIWRAMTLKAHALLGYVHQWKDARFQAFKLLCMASCDTEQQAVDATAKGWRVFRVRTALEPRLAGEVVCPASHEAGQKTTCEDCKACGGHSAKAKANIVIVSHGVAHKVKAFASIQARLIAAEQLQARLYSMAAE